MMLNRLIPRAFALALTSIVLLSLVAGCATATNDSEQFYLDPQTGAVTADPPATASQNEKQNTEHDQAAHAPARIIQCPDGSLRMGVPDDDKSRKDASAEDLCDRPVE